MPYSKIAALARIEDSNELRRISIVTGTRTVEDVCTAACEAVNDFLRQAAGGPRTVVRDIARTRSRRFDAVHAHTRTSVQ
jgi:hypothetical protein